MLTTIRPPTNDPLKMGAIGKALKNALEACAKGAKADFETTTRTWQTSVEFKIEEPSDDVRTVTTTSEVYAYVNKGTNAHVILPRRGRMLTWVGTTYRAKTSPGFIGSRRGGNNSEVMWAQQVFHPGTDPRDFDEAIMTKWQTQMPIVFRNALVAAVGS